MVTAEILKSRNDEETFKVIKKIYFEGNERVSEKKLKECLSIYEKTFINAVADYNEIYLKFESLTDASEDLVYFYKKNGYTDVSILESGSEKTGAPFRFKNRMIQYYNVFFKIHEGKQKIVEQIEISGAGKSNINEVKKRVRLKINEPLNPYLLIDVKKDILLYYNNLGYFDSRLDTEKIELDDKGNIKLKFVIREGGIYQFGKIFIRGNEFTRPQIIKRELSIKEDDLYSTKRILEDQRKLYNTALFSGVKLESSGVDTLGRKVEILVKVIEKKSRWLSLGFGSSSSELENIRFTGEWGHNNLFGTARRLKFGALSTWRFRDLLDPVNTIENTRSRFEIDFVEPWIARLPVTGGSNLYYDRELILIPEFLPWSKRWGITESLSKNFGMYSKLWFILGLGWINEAGYINMIHEQTNFQVTRSLSFKFQRDSRDNIFDPVKGSLLELGFSHTGGFLGGDYAYRKYHANATWYHSIKYGQVLAARSEAGFVDPFLEDKRDIPSNDRFYAGGATTVRGYNEYGLSSTNTPYIGGNVLLLGNIEYRLHLYWRFYSVFFLDAGQVFPFFSSVEMSDIQFTAGTGLRYKTPIGPLRIDYGIKLKSDPNDPRKYRFHFSIGQTF